MKLKGNWHITLYGPDRSIKDVRQGNNVVTEDGTSFVAAFLASAAAAASTFTMDYVAIGTDVTAESSSDTALGAELARVQAVISNVTGSIYRLTASFPSGSTFAGAITEYGIFNSSAAGTMLARDTEAVINKGADDTLVIVSDITVS